MAITTEAGLIAGLRPSTYFMKAATTAKAAGTPHAQGLIAAGSFPLFTAGTPGLSGATVDGTSSTLGGTLPFKNPASGSTYLPRFRCVGAASILSISIFDLLWYNTGIGITTTTAQTVNSITLPSRDMYGTTNGDGVFAWLYASAATTNAGAVANTTISYTNSANSAGKTGTLLQSWPATATAGTFMPFALAAGDDGIRSIQSITLGTSYVTGTVLLMLTRQITTMGLLTASSGFQYDWAQTGNPVLYDGSALSFYVMPTGTAVGTIVGDLVYSQG